VLNVFEEYFTLEQDKEELTPISKQIQYENFGELDIFRNAYYGTI